MEKSVKQTSICSHITEDNFASSHIVENYYTGEDILLCDECYNLLVPNPPITEDDRYYQYLEDHQEREDN